MIKKLKMEFIGRDYGEIKDGDYGEIIGRD